MFRSILEYRGHFFFSVYVKQHFHPQLFILFIGFVFPDATSVAKGTEAGPENQQPVSELSDLVSPCLSMGTDVLEGTMKQMLKLPWHVLLHIFVTWEKSTSEQDFFYGFEEQAMGSQLNMSVEDRIEELLHFWI